MFEVRLAACEAGRGRYGRSAALLDHAEKAAVGTEDVFIWLTILRVRAHLSAAGRVPGKSDLSAFETDTEIPWNPAYGAYSVLSLGLVGLVVLGFIPAHK